MVARLQVTNERPKLNQIETSLTLHPTQMSRHIISTDASRTKQVVCMYIPTYEIWKIQFMLFITTSTLNIHPHIDPYKADRVVPPYAQKLLMQYI